jgi:hypothetical protein
MPKRLRNLKTETKKPKKKNDRVENVGGDGVENPESKLRTRMTRTAKRTMTRRPSQTPAMTKIQTTTKNKRKHDHVVVVVAAGSPVRRLKTTMTMTMTRSRARRTMWKRTTPATKMMTMMMTTMMMMIAPFDHDAR